MRVRNGITSLLLAVAGVVSTVCDPGVSYRPAAWAQVAEFRWRSSIAEGLEFETTGTTALIGASRLAPEFTVTNQTPQAVIVVSAILTTRTGRYESIPIAPGHMQWFTAQPGEKKRITLSFRLPGAVGEILAEPVVLNVRVRHGSTDTVVSIPLVRG